ncbi:MAG: rod shape-determining protein MreD [Oscillospiraceae bacterium]
MQKEKNRPAIKWAIYYAILLVLFVMQTTPNFLEFFSFKPIFVLPICVCVCMFEDVLPSGIFCVITGLLWDLSSNKLFGFNAIILLACGVFISLLCIYYLHTKLTNSILFSTIVLAIQGLLDYLFYYLIWGYKDSHLILLKHIFPNAIYTIIVGIPIYFLILKISKKFHIVNRA